MVVTRKTPVAPVQHVSSRTNSSQAVPRPTKGKGPETIPNAPEQSLFVNGESQKSSNHDPNLKGGPIQSGSPSKSLKSKKKTESKKGSKSRKNTSGFVDHLVRAFFTFFVIYSLSVCPDAAFENPICRGLTSYHRLILEPYVLPPIRMALAHPSVAPHIERIQPQVDRIIATAKPVALRTQAEWKTRVVPQWNKRIVPQWNKRIVPQWNKHIMPHWNKRVVLQWRKHVLPRIRHAKKNYVEPCRVHVQTAKPYAITLWRKIKVAFRHLLMFARAQRRQFVDPHVARMWEKVKELSRGKTSSVAFVPSSQVDSDISSRFDADPSPQVDADPPSQVDPDPSPQVLPPQVDSDPLSQVDPHPSSQVEADVLSQVDADTSSQVYPDPSSRVGPEPSSEIEQEPSSQADEDADIDLASFYADLGLDDSDNQPNPTLIAPPSPQETETEEEKAERLVLAAEKIAKKRADIVTRHTKWEEKVEALIKEKRKDLRKALVAMRKVATTELKESTEIRVQVDTFVAEAEKFLKGAEVYLKNLKQEKRKDEEKMSLWERVVGKVETKFSEKISEIEHFVNEWYAGILAREVQAVRDAVAPVRLLAEQAQADLGLDYAWLEDVTYHDWQRYHALVGRSDDFLVQANSIQNGSHPSPPIDPVVPAVIDLYSEVRDIVVGFETRLRRIKRSGERAFSVAASEEDSAIDDNQPEPEVSILPIPGDSGAVREGAESAVIGRGKNEILQAMERAQGSDALQPDGSEEAEEGQMLQAEANTEAAGPHIEL